jgi:hypothetical protein
VIGPASTATPPPARRADRWLAVLGVLTLLCAGVFVVSVTRTRAAVARVQHAERTIRATLDRQGAALLRGDRAGWLSDVDPALAGRLTWLYANLRGLQVSGWLPRARKVRSEQGWSADVQVRVCFATAACTRTAETFVPLGDVISARTRWHVSGDRAVLTSFEQLATEGSVPWKQEPLEFAVGERVVVAAARGQPEVRPAQWLPAAERAATVADRYVLSDPRPGRYFLFLAGEKQWNDVVRSDREAAAFVDRTSESTAFAIVDATDFGTDPTDERLLRHELGHIATLFGTLDNDAEWAIEGMAEYIAYAGTPVPAYDLVADARWHVEHTGWTGRLDLEWSGEPDERHGFYAMGFLAMRCLGETYGEPRLLAFFTAVVRRGEQPGAAAESSLGVPWEQAQAGCRPKIEAWLRA